MNSHPIKTFAAIVPLLMSALLILLIVIDTISPLGPSIPVHDEYTWDHIAMLLFFGQAPFIVYFGVCHRREFKKAGPILILQLVLVAGIFVAITHGDRTTHEVVARRIRDSTALPGSQAALGRFIEEQQRGEPSDSPMDGIVARFLTQAPMDLGSLGPVQSLNFRGVDGIGWDIYKVRFANGEGEFRIFVGPKGIIHGLTYTDAKLICRSSEVYECRSESRVALR